MRRSGYGRAGKLNVNGGPPYKLCVPISDSLHDRLIRLADTMELPLAQVVRIAIVELLQREDVE